MEQDNSAQIHDYLFNRMSIQDRQQFEIRLQTDMQLKEEYQTEKEIQRTVQMAALKNQLGGIEQQFMAQAVPPRKVVAINRFKWAFAMAASIVLVSGLYFWLNNRQANEKIYATYYQPDPGLPTFMGEGNYTFADAMVDYKSQRYDSAVAKFKSLSAAAPGNDTLKYYYGMSLMGKGQFDEARLQLNGIAASSTYYKNALWYAILTDVKQHKKTDVLKLIQISEDSTDVHQEAAGKLILDLGKSLR